MPPVKKDTATASQQLLLVCIFAVLLLPLAGPKFIAGQIIKEQSNYAGVLGAERADTILARSDSWFRRAFVDTGMATRSLKTDSPAPPAASTRSAPATGATAPQRNPFAAKPQESGQSEAIQPSSDNPVKKLLRHWIGGAWSIAYLMMGRLSILLSLLPVLLPLMVAVMLDGSARSKMKWFAFGGSDPKRYIIGVRLGTWSAMIALFALISPGSLPGLAIPVLLVLSSVGFAMWMSNQQKPM